ncbi:unnamed protein product [Polarella glacialis]|uniref:BART domain-containing protein n=1 Tax=Polarella glacialis TaxID=89957 RepID=A0A813DWF7_POLGL|nr:unnamed protein product [Polarella glacialis]
MDVDVVEQLEEAVLADEVQQAAEEFLLRRLPLFECMTDDQLAFGNAEEQRLEWHEVYREYAALMEDLVLQACLAESPNLCREDVYAELSRVAESPDEASAAARSCACFFLSMFEYDSFLSMMKELVRRQRGGLELSFGARPRPEPELERE